METGGTKILIVDDDLGLCQLLGEYLGAEGFEVSSVHCGEDALNQVQSGDEFNAIILDVMMPGISGTEVLQSLRTRVSTPIIMLTGKGSEIDRIIGLELGADDYLAKPCNPRELLARIRAVLRRTKQTISPAPAQSSIHLHGIDIHLGQRTLSINGNAIELTSAEFTTLALLMESAGQILSKEELTEKVLQRKLSAYDRSIDVHISRVRQKIKPALAEIKMQEDPIRTIRGKGYLFISEAEAGA